VVTGAIPAPPGAPTVLLYSHYDVVPAGDAESWDSPPFEPTVHDGAMFGRGAADTKSNIMMHVGALRARGGKPPVGIRLCIEGYEEIGSGALLAHAASDPDGFAADALIVGDMGSIAPGTPTLTTALRGMAREPGGHGRGRLPVRGLLEARAAVDRAVRRGRGGAGAGAVELLTGSAVAVPAHGETRTRTGDTTIFSRVLYQLSYLAVEPRG
jgi:Peptidase family M20/M25/M40